jgi:hypothetical protein
MDQIDRVEARLELLEDFLKEVQKWAGKFAIDEDDLLYVDPAVQQKLAREMAESRSRVNRMLIAAKQAVMEAGISTSVEVGAPAILGGRVDRHVDIFGMIFTPMYGMSFVPHVLCMVEQAIGVYQNLKDGTGLVRVGKRESLDILGAIERALRPAFKQPPTNEKAVQDIIETILQSVGVSYHREKERAPVGPTAFIPDFTLPDLNLAIEAKLTNVKHSAADVQREIAEDITAFRTKWPHILFVVYDCGVISDPEQLRRENQKLFGVRVLVVKH